MSNTPLAILWFRQDLRLEDNSALAHALCEGYAILPLYIWQPSDNPLQQPGAASQWWLHHALHDLDNELQKHGSRLILRSGEASRELHTLIAETSAHAVFWNRVYEPAAQKRDQKIKKQLGEENREVRSFNSSLLLEPTHVKNQSGEPYQVFTPFYQFGRKQEIPSPAEPGFCSWQNPSQWPSSLSLEQLKLLPSISWDSTFYNHWEPTLAAARGKLNRFVNKEVKNYAELRDFPAEKGTSRLSPYLHWGQIGPRQIWALGRETRNAEKSAPFLRQLFWREFAHHLLYHFPHTTTKALREEFQLFPWEEDEKILQRWQRGETGYPIVDAAMRELWETGWMHNRPRMIVGSLLVKHLLQPWQAGAAWFWDTLVDADLANNTLGWQWIAGCGADAAPYFRIFNPILQGEKFDPQGDYVRTFLPELKNIPNKFLHHPWDAPASVLKESGITLGKNYPNPIISHQEGRQRALKSFEPMKRPRESRSCR